MINRLYSFQVDKKQDELISICCNETVATLKLSLVKLLPARSTKAFTRFSLLVKSLQF